MKEATLEQLDIADVPFPEGFKPKYMAMEEGGCWFVFDTMPRFDGSWWENIDGGSYEIGVDNTPTMEITPKVCKNVTPEESIFKIK